MYPIDKVCFVLIYIFNSFLTSAWVRVLIMRTISSSLFKLSL